ncbi:glycosyltransferase family 2 protein [Mucilaginibacter sabulilitoris]|uniref:Glycosyltransferase family 2 protein n=1 Tax=Mucilaginibacter sabulilitoris TaxID=1173583 RepID=A0ABZ0TKD3_9SPHI|nr:glycosyltransferase family 2 protein [Mucilaginibacter sabulilitoris]WPU91645.1 glycosyltransferase family 2 protein [Mucilaginibacter sabulilitoris]
MRFNLPDLNDYRTRFLNDGIVSPLKTTGTPENGLLGYLPGCSGDQTGWPWTAQVDPDTYNGNNYWPKLTIVTPSYNQGAFIEQTIRAVLLQNYPNLEYIIIDGGSTDNTREILEKYAPWISYWQSVSDDGQANAINLGFSLASGHYRAWINSDDYYLSGTFHHVIKTFIKTKVSFIYGYAYNLHADTGTLEMIKVLPVLDYFLRMPTLAQPSCFWSAGIHQPVIEQLQCSMDYELWLRMVRGNSRKLLRSPLSVAHVHRQAKTYDPKMSDAWQNDHDLICHPENHGPVQQWARKIWLHKIYNRFIKLIEKVTFHQRA